MAAYRKKVPLRETSTIEVDDGTSCRMPSPIPGPLRSESVIEFVGSSNSFKDRISVLRGLMAATNSRRATLVKGEAA